MSAIVAAKDVTVLVDVDGDMIAVGCATSIELEFTNEIIGKTDVNAGLFRKKRVRISDFTGSVTGLITLFNTVSNVSAFHFLQEAVRRSELTMQFLFTDEDGNVKTITGVFLVQSERLSGGAESDFAEFDLQLEGTGGFEIADLPSPSDVECFETFSDWWQPTAAATSFSGAGQNGRSFAGATIIEVVREIAPPMVFTAGTPGDGTYGYDGTTITVWASNPFSGSEKVFVIWQQTA